MKDADCHVASLLAMTQRDKDVYQPRHCQTSPQTGRGNPFPEKMYYVYILTNTTGTVVYTGVTNDLIRRVYEHKHNADPNSFTAKYSVHKLVYFEQTTSRYEAISREKQLKSWNRKRKNQLVESQNPKWEELYDSLL